MSLQTSKQSFSKRALASLIGPDGYDFWAREFGTTAAWQRCFARVLCVERNGCNSLSIHLRPNKNFAGFQAGQHINVTAEIEGRRLTRSYSLSNTANSEMNLEITVRHDPQGKMSGHLHTAIKVGSVLEISQAFGGMSLPSGPECENPVLLLAAGSGISPLMGLLRQRCETKTCPPTTLLYWDYDDAHFCFKGELNQLCANNPQLHVHRLTTRSAAQADGRISEAQIKQLHGNCRDTMVYACGGSAFVETARALLSTQARDFTAEAFTPPATTANSEVQQQIAIQLNRSGRTITVSNQESLLDALEAQGIAVESGCRMGICNTCSCQKLQGSTTNQFSGEQNNATNSSIRLCISRANGPLQLDL
tara:strand:- start:2227 stop:3318 length:1092 start_codon:yes stop_codon:yes gene_type:complete